MKEIAGVIRIVLTLFIFISFHLIANAQNIASVINLDEFGERVSALSASLIDGLQEVNTNARQQAAATFAKSLGVTSADVFLGFSKQMVQDPESYGLLIQQELQLALEGALQNVQLVVAVEEIARIVGEAIAGGLESVQSGGDVATIINKVVSEIVNPVFQELGPNIQSFTTTTAATGSSSTSSTSSVVSTSSTLQGPQIEDLKTSLLEYSASIVSNNDSITPQYLISSFAVQFVQLVGDYLGKVLVSGSIDEERNANEITEALMTQFQNVLAAGSTVIIVSDLEQVEMDIRVHLGRAFREANQSGSDLEGILNGTSQDILNIIVLALNNATQEKVVSSSSATSVTSPSSLLFSSPSASTTSALDGQFLEEQRQLFVQQFIEVMSKIEANPRQAQNQQAFLSLILGGTMNATVLVIDEDVDVQVETIADFYQAALEGVQIEVGGSFDDLDVDAIVSEIKQTSGEALADFEFSSRVPIDHSNFTQQLVEQLIQILGAELGEVVPEFYTSNISLTMGSTSPLTTSFLVNITSPSSIVESGQTIEDLIEKLSMQLQMAIASIEDTPSDFNIQLLMNAIIVGVLNGTQIVIQDDAETQSQVIGDVFAAAFTNALKELGGEFESLTLYALPSQIQMAAFYVFSNYSLKSSETLDLLPVAQQIANIVFNEVGPLLSSVIPGFQFTISGVVSSSTATELREDLLNNFMLHFEALAADNPQFSDLQRIIESILQVIFRIATNSTTVNAEEQSTLVVNLLNQTLPSVLNEVGNDFQNVDVQDVLDDVQNLSYKIFVEISDGGESITSVDIQRIINSSKVNLTQIIASEVVAAVPSIQVIAGSFQIAPIPEVDKNTESIPTLVPKVEPEAATTTTVSPIGVFTNIHADLSEPPPAGEATQAKDETISFMSVQTTMAPPNSLGFNVYPRGISMLDFRVSAGQLAEIGLANVTNATNLSHSVNEFASQFGINLANVVVYLFQNGIGDVRTTSLEISDAISEALIASVTVNNNFADLDIDTIVAEIENVVQASLTNLEDGDDINNVVKSIANEVVVIIFNSVFQIAQELQLGIRPVQASFMFNATGGSFGDLRQRLIQETEAAFEQISASSSASTTENIVQQLSVNIANVLGNILLAVLQAGSDEVDAIQEAKDISGIVENVLAQASKSGDIEDLEIASIIVQINGTLVDAIIAAQDRKTDTNNIIQNAASEIFSAVINAFGNALGIQILGTVSISTNMTSSTSTTRTAMVDGSSLVGVSPEEFQHELQALFNQTLAIILADSEKETVQGAVESLANTLIRLIADVTLNLVSNTTVNDQKKARALAGAFESSLTIFSDANSDLSQLDITSITSNIEVVAQATFQNITELSGSNGSGQIDLTPLVQELVNQIVSIVIQQLMVTIPGFQFNIAIESGPTSSTNSSSQLATNSSGSLKEGEIEGVCTCYTDEEFDARVMSVVAQMLSELNYTLSS